MKIIFVSMVGISIWCYATEPTLGTTTTQTREPSSAYPGLQTRQAMVDTQVQRIEIPAHIKGLRIINNNTLNWSDTANPAYTYPVQDRQYKQQVVPTQQSSALRTLLSAGVALGTGLLCVYSGMRAYVYLLTHELEKKSHWWNWKTELSVSALMQLPEQQNAHDLLREIQRRYATTTVTDVAFIMPLVHFVQDTHHEQEFLEHLIKLHERLQAYGLQHIFGCDEQVVVQARAQVARLAYIRGLCMKWLSSYAVDVPRAA